MPLEPWHNFFCTFAILVLYVYNYLPVLLFFCEHFMAPPGYKTCIAMTNQSPQASTAAYHRRSLYEDQFVVFC
jgi:hypothetical protein